MSKSSIFFVCICLFVFFSFSCSLKIKKVSKSKTLECPPGKSFLLMLFRTHEYLISGPLDGITAEILLTKPEAYVPEARWCSLDDSTIFNLETGVYLTYMGTRKCSIFDGKCNWLLYSAVRGFDETHFDHQRQWKWEQVSGNTFRFREGLTQPDDKYPGYLTFIDSAKLDAIDGVDTIWIKHPY